MYVYLNNGCHSSLCQRSAYRVHIFMRRWYIRVALWWAGGWKRPSNPFATCLLATFETYLRCAAARAHAQIQRPHRPPTYAPAKIFRSTLRLWQDLNSNAQFCVTNDYCDSVRAGEVNFRSKCGCYVKTVAFKVNLVKLNIYWHLIKLCLVKKLSINYIF